MIQLDNVWFDYEPETSPRSDWKLQAISIGVSSGEYVAIMGDNGSGKSTLARIISGLITPCDGRMSIDQQYHTNNLEDIWNIRQCAALILQNPDNQIVGPTVADDIAFGLENIGVPHEEMKLRMQQVLSQLGLLGLEDAPPHHLSGGQKQRLAIACMLGMHPDILLLDEATSMLDPQAKNEIMQILTELHLQRKTILHITHNIQEALQADRLLVMARGGIVIDIQTQEILANLKQLKQHGIRLPDSLELANRLMKRGWNIRTESNHPRDVVNAICKYLSKT